MLFVAPKGFRSLLLCFVAVFLTHFLPTATASLVLPEPSPSPNPQQLPSIPAIYPSPNYLDASNTNTNISTSNQLSPNPIPPASDDTLLTSQQIAQECRGATLNTTLSPGTNTMTLRWNLQALQRNLYSGPPQDVLECSFSLSLGGSWQFAARSVEWVGRARLPKPGLGLKTSIRFGVGSQSPKRYSWTLPAPSERNFVLKGDFPAANRLWTSCGSNTPDYMGVIQPPAPMNVDWVARLIAQDMSVQGGILWIPPPENQPFHLVVTFDLRGCPGF